MITGLHHISLKCGTPEEFDKAKAFYMVLKVKTILHQRW